MKWFHQTAMVQSVNIKGITTLASVIRRPYLISPHVSVDAISEIDFMTMNKKCGIRGIIFDKDNTITAPYDLTVHPKASVGLNQALDIFGSENVAILSNSAGSKDDIDYEHAIEIEQAMGINVIRHDEKKPGGLKDVLKHFPGIDEPSQLCMIGDRLLTDVLFGNLYGMLTVHCLPLCSGEDNVRDNFIASKIRSIENVTLYGNWFGGKMIRRRTLLHSSWPGNTDCPLVLVPEKKLEE